MFMMADLYKHKVAIIGVILLKVLPFNICRTTLLHQCNVNRSSSKTSKARNRFLMLPLCKYKTYIACIFVFLQHSMHLCTCFLRKKLDIWDFYVSPFPLTKIRRESIIWSYGNVKVQYLSNFVFMVQGDPERSFVPRFIYFNFLAK